MAQDKMTGFVGFNTTPEKKAAIYVAADARGMSQSQFLRAALDAALKNAKTPGE